LERTDQETEKEARAHKGCRAIQEEEEEEEEEERSAGETDVLGENLPHHKSHLTRPGRIMTSSYRNVI
jgi:hypothetical protein